MAELESITQSKIIKHLRQFGYIVFRLRATDKAGTPDLLVLKNKVAFFIEVKQVSKEPTAIQLNVHEQLRKEGFEVKVWDAKTIMK